MDNIEFAEQREDLLQSIQRDEEEVRAAVQQLTTAARSHLEVREYIKAFPMSWMIGAFLVGAWLGISGPSRTQGRGGYDDNR